jgi:hypothetical protein
VAVVGWQVRTFPVQQGDFAKWRSSVGIEGEEYAVDIFWLDKQPDSTNRVPGTVASNAKRGTISALLGQELKQSMVGSRIGMDPNGRSAKTPVLWLARAL